MSGMLAEHVVDCPYCGETIDVFIDTSAGDQSYIEDCFVCCRPIQFTIVLEGDEVAGLHAAQSD